MNRRTTLPSSRLHLLSIPVFAAALVAAATQPRAAKLVHDSIPGPITQTRVRFTVALPDDYAADKGPYPVVYHLHGIGGNEQGNQTMAVPKVFEAARGKGLIGPVVVVFPNGLTNSFWADARNGSKQVETQIIRELMPYIDSTYRTRTDGAGRFIQGFSMGGFGAAKFMAKFPDRFRACVIYDGALLDWKALKQRHADVARDMFDNDSAYWAGYNPHDLLRKNAAALGADYPVKMAVGALTDFNQAFRDSLADHGLRPDYEESNCEHVLSCLLEAEGENTARLYGTLLAGTPTAPGRSEQAPARARFRPTDAPALHSAQRDASGRLSRPWTIQPLFPVFLRLPPVERQP